MASVGDILRDTRIAQQHSIDDIAQATKIRSTILVAIENNQFDVLPPPYMKSFVKTYAQVLNISGHEDVQSFLAASAEARAKSKNIQPPQQAKRETTDSIVEQFSVGQKSSPVNMLVYSGLALGVLVLAYYFLWYEQQPSTLSQEQPIPSVKPIEIQHAAPTITDNSEEASIQQEQEEIPVQDSLILEGTTTARVWISIVSDGKKSMQRLLDINTTYRWSADSVFVISLGNAGGIQFTLNGKALPALGREGAIVRNLHITRSGVVSSASPYTTASSTQQYSAQQQRTQQPVTQQQPKQPEATQQVRQQPEATHSKQPETTQQRPKQRQTAQRQPTRQRPRTSLPSITPVEPRLQAPTLPRPEEKSTAEQ